VATVDHREPLLPLRSSSVEAYSAAFFLANAEMPGLRANTIGARRQRFVGDGLHERVELRCFANRPVRFELRLAVGADFADIFEIKETVRDRSQEINREHEPGSLRFLYRNRSFVATTTVEVSPAATRVDGDDLVWELCLEPDTEWRCELNVPLTFGPSDMRPEHRHFHEVFDHPENDPASRWRAAAPMLHSESDLLAAVFERSVQDLVALRIHKRLRDEDLNLPAAGLPWFLSIFGRDTLITAYQSVCFGPRLSRGALLMLALQQGQRVDDFRDEEPGKILHEIRNGELTQLGIMPYSPYYGTSDATQLWLILLSEYWRWTRDDGLVRELRDNAYAALRWIDQYGRPGRRRVRRVSDPVPTRVRQPLLARLLGRGAVLRRHHPAAAHRHLRNPGLHLRTPSCAWPNSPTDPWPIPPSPSGFAARHSSCGNGSTGTSGSSGEAATTRSGWTGTNARSTR